MKPVLGVDSDVRPRGWFWAEDEVFSLRVSIYAKMTLLYLKRCADHDGLSWPSQETIGEAIGATGRRVANALSELISANVLAVESGKQSGVVNRYTIKSVADKGVGTEFIGGRNVVLRGSERGSEGVGTEFIGGRNVVLTEGIPIEGIPKKDTTTMGLSAVAEAPASAWAQAPWGTAEALAHLYNERGPDNIPAVTTLSARRRDRARKWLKEFPDKTWWEAVFDEYHRSRFLSGRTKPTAGHENFRPDFDWLLANGKTGTENAVKVHDGAYSD